MPLFHSRDLRAQTDNAVIRKSDVIEGLHHGHRRHRR